MHYLLNVYLLSAYDEAIFMVLKCSDVVIIFYFSGDCRVLDAEGRQA